MARRATEKGNIVAKVLHIPEILGIQQAKNSLSKMMKSLEHGQTYIIKGTKGRAALVIGLDEFKELQDSYLELAKKLEVLRALDKKETREALKVASEEELPTSEDELVTSVEIKDEYLAKQPS